MTSQRTRVRPSVNTFTRALVLASTAFLSETASAGTWIPIVHSAPGAVDRMLLLSDGTVMATDNVAAWYRLTPDVHGRTRVKG